MELTVLGAGPAYTNRPGSIGAAYLLREGGSAVVLDLGQGSFPALASRLEPSRLDAVIVSHLHPDHFIDLVALRHYLRYEFEPPRRVTVHGPAGLDDRLDALHAEPGFAAQTLDVHALLPGTVAIAGFSVEARRVAHTEDSHAFRVTAGDGPGLVYSGDCGRWEDLVPLVHEGDTLLVEVSFGPGPVPSGAMHLDATGIARLIAATRPSRVLLTHLQMGFDPAATVAAAGVGFRGPIELVEPGFAARLDG
jgi:ribonuclease BN (tRNA processing enzyme)